MAYTGNSIVDFLGSTGQKSDYASRATLAASKGITGYTGSAQQNTQLLNILRGSGSTPAPATTTAPTAQPTATPQAQPATPGQVQPQSVQDLISMGYSGYTGWDTPGALADFKATQGAGKGGPASSGGATGLGGSTGFMNTPTINLPEIYQTLYDQSGVSGLEKQLSDQTKSFTEAQSKINDNPFLSEATRVGRIAKLNTDFNARSQGTRNDIATKKADIETRLNIQTKQFDVNSQQATQALAQFQTLLSSGALSNASGEDIANITRATGMSSTMINAAINATKAKDVKTEIIKYDDGTNQGFAVVNSNTGAIINKQAIAASEPKKGTGGGTTDLKSQFSNDAKTIKGSQTSAGYIGQFPQLVAKYAPFMSLEEIYKMYLTTDIGKKYGTPTESASDIKEIYDAYSGKN